MQLAVVLLLGAALLSLGPFLSVDGRLTRIPLPFVLLDAFPFVDNILPIRISFEVGACLAAVAAFGLDDMRRAPSCGYRRGSPRRFRLQGRRSVGFAVVTIAVLIVTQLPQWPNPSLPVVALPVKLNRAIPGGDPAAITYPYDTADYLNQPMLWQVENGFTFRLLGGYAYHPGRYRRSKLVPNLMSPPGLQQFLASQEGVPSSLYGPALPLGPTLVASTRAALAQYDVRLVIVDRSVGGSGPVMELMSEAIGPPKLSIGQFSMWAHWHGSPG